jgi:CO dehydrogenase/acetyl-CoA synthase beta subunit
MTIIHWFLRLISPPCEACHRSLYEEDIEQYTWCSICQAFTATPAPSSPRRMATCHQRVDDDEAE